MDLDVAPQLGWRFEIRTDSVEGRIRTDWCGFRAAPQRFVCGILQYIWVFRPYRNGFRIRTDSVESRIRTDSDGFQDPKYGQPRPTVHYDIVISCHSVNDAHNIIRVFTAQGFRVKKCGRERRDACIWPNSKVEMCTHSGTHVDAPWQGGAG